MYGHPVPSNRSRLWCIARVACSIVILLDLAASFLVPAELYFLDEPTTG